MTLSKHWTSENMGAQTGKISIVTGANSGIGFEMAKALVLKGAKVVLACRNEERGKQAVAQIMAESPAGEALFMSLDLSDLKAVAKFAEAFKENYDRLDLLINNAGVMMPPYSQTADGFELQFGTNHLGHFVLTGQLLSRLLNTKDSRVVTVSSNGHRGGKIVFDDLQWEKRRYRKIASYGQSKLANLLFTYELQRRLEAAGAGTIAVAAHPGWTLTNLWRHTSIFDLPNILIAMKPWQGALPTLYAATAGSVKGGEYYGPSGLLQFRGYPKQVKSNKASHDLETARRLWEVSEELVGLAYTIKT